MRSSLALAFGLLMPCLALAQSTPNWTQGYVPSPAEWNNLWASKQDYPVASAQSRAFLTPYDFQNANGHAGYGDTLRRNCAVTTTAASTALTAASPCAFTAADVGKILVVNNAGSSNITPLVTTIAGFSDATHITMGAAAGQTIAAVTEPVTWGHDDSGALQACINASTTGGTVCFIPGLPANAFWGSAASLELFPNSLNVRMEGISRQRSVVIALAALPYLVHRGGGFNNGGTLRDIAFDGNKIAADVGYFSCVSFRADYDVGFYNAGTDADLIYGDAAGAATNCNTSHAYFFDVKNNNSALYADHNDYPNYNLLVGNTDCEFFGLVAAYANSRNVWVQGGSAAAYNTSFYGLHPFGGNGAVAATGVQMDATVGFISNLECDVATTTCAFINAGQVTIIGGHSSSGNTNGISIAAGTLSTRIVGFDTTQISTAANRIVYGDGTAINGTMAVAVSGASTEINSQTFFNQTQFRPTPVLVSQLPGCVPNNANLVQGVTDGNAPAYGSTITGGGTAHLMVMCDGTNWIAR